MSGSVFCKIKHAASDDSYCYYCLAERAEPAPFCRVYLTGYEEQGADFSLERRGYDNYLLLCTTEGEAVFSCDKGEYRLKSGDVLAVDCREYHRYRTARAPWKYAFVHMDGAALEAVLSRADIRKSPVIADSELLLAKRLFCLHRLIEEAGQGTEGEVRTSNAPKKLTLTYDFYEDACRPLSHAIQDTLVTLSRLTEQRDPSLSDPTVRLGTEFIRRHFTEEISLDEIAAAFVSKYYFERRFKQVMGRTVMGYVGELRLELARQLLSHGGISRREAARAVGWSLPTLNAHLRHSGNRGFV